MRSLLARWLEAPLVIADELVPLDAIEPSAPLGALLAQTFGATPDRGTDTAIVKDEDHCIRCALCVKRCPFDAITMERFELQEISSDGRLYKESYRDAQLAGTAGVAGGPR